LGGALSDFAKDKTMTEGKSMDKPDAGAYAAVFKALADETRVKIMQMLNTRPRAVNEIVDFFSLSQPTISRHLMVLRQSGLVNAKRRGQQVIYSINEDTLRDKALAFFAGFECCSQAGAKKK
jgi:ArsR family transcriptional regulator, arsenate/arsenite/antimonite-responsive transcriptional repressor